MARRTHGLFGVMCTSAAALVGLAGWLLLGSGVCAATASASQRRQPGDLIVPPPLPPLTAPEPKPPIARAPRNPPPTVITPAVARSALRRGNRIYVAPSSEPELRRELVQRLRSWRRLTVVPYRRYADVEMKVERSVVLGGIVAADGVTTPMSTTHVALSVHYRRTILWMGLGSTVSDTLGAFTRAVDAADAADAK